MKKILLATVLTVMAVGCGDDPSAVKASGSVALTVHQAGQPNGSTNMTFPEGTIIDAPPGIGRGFFGTCARTNNGWIVSISRADGGTDGLRKVDINAPLNSFAGPVSIAFRVGQTSFEGGGACTGTVNNVGENGMSLTARCLGLSAMGDLRTVDGDLTLQLTNCTSGR